ncbi:MAG: DUF4917 family protein [Bacteroidales bacterium]|nr:DUF4917 family protein [Bacteroidales bacterium]
MVETIGWNTVFAFTQWFWYFQILLIWRGVHMIQSWDDIKDRYKNGKLIVGNTLSCYLNEPLDYDHPKNIFLDELDTDKTMSQLHNHHIFEEIPRKIHKDQLKTTKKLLRLFFHDTPLEEIFHSLFITTSMVKNLYKHSQSLERVEVTECNSFFTSQYDILKRMYTILILHIHPNFHPVEANYPYYLSFLKHFRYIFSLSYDLSLQWSIMKDVEWFQDGFGKTSKTSKKVYFSTENLQKRDTNTFVFYTHGNFSMIKDAFQNVTKIAPKGSSLIHRICEYILSDRFPLIVTEGGKNYKETAVRSEKVYLNKIYEEFLPESLDSGKGYSNSLVIYGQVMESDEYILSKVLEDSLLDSIAISVDNDDFETSQKTQQQIQTILKQPTYKGREVNFDFFESFTIEKPI